MKKHLNPCPCETRIQARYWEPCPGCIGGHASFWKTIVESPEWKEWEQEVARRVHADEEGCFDVDESRECGWFSPNHFKAFLEFTKTPH